LSLSFTGDGAYDTPDVYATVAARQADAAVIVPPRATALRRSGVAPFPLLASMRLCG
jgi:hypothetical protein